MCTIVKQPPRYTDVVILLCIYMFQHIIRIVKNTDSISEVFKCDVYVRSKYFCDQDLTVVTQTAGTKIKSMIKKNHFYFYICRNVDKNNLKGNTFKRVLIIKNEISKIIKTCSAIYHIVTHKIVFNKHKLSRACIAYMDMSILMKI